MNYLDVNLHIPTIISININNLIHNNTTDLINTFTNYITCIYILMIFERKNKEIKSIEVNRIKFRSLIIRLQIKSLKKFLIKIRRSQRVLISLSFIFFDKFNSTNMKEFRFSCVNITPH